MNQTKRIVIIEGDAFDADAIVAIVKFRHIETKFGVYCDETGDPFDYEFTNESERNVAFTLAVAAWRDVDLVYAPPPAHPEPLPFPPVIDEPVERPNYWSDENGRFFETYGGKPISIDAATGERFIWNEGPPRRKNHLGEGATPILKTYVDEAGKPLDPQPS